MIVDELCRRQAGIPALSEPYPVNYDTESATRDCAAHIRRVTQIDMLRSYVGLISERGLETLWPEFEDTHRFLARRLPRERTRGKLGYWAVLDDVTADRVRHLIAQCEYVTALHIVQLQAAHFGAIWPEEPDVDQVAGQYFPKV